VAARGVKNKKRIPFLKNEPEKLLKIKDWRTKTNPNEPKNEAGKLLKTCRCGKNEPKNEAGHVVENTARIKNEPKTKRRQSWHFPMPERLAGGL
jgi:hypothetical protein